MFFSKSEKPVVKEQRGKGGEITEKDRAMLELKSARNKVQKYKKQVSNNDEFVLY